MHAGAVYVAPVRTPATLAEIRAAVAEALGAPENAPSVSLGVAQIDLETAGGAKMWNWNVGNVKATDLWSGAFTCIKLTEVINGETVHFWPAGEVDAAGAVVGQAWKVPPGHPQTRMRAFATLEDGVRSWEQTLRRARYASAWEALQAGEVGAFAAGLKKGGYFTADAGKYAAGLLERLKKTANSEGIDNQSEAVEHGARSNPLPVLLILGAGAGLVLANRRRRA
jgi:hypothetical protein